MKRYFGDEYPEAVTIDGVRLPLAWETRWCRHYGGAEHKLSSHVSRFMDGSAVVTFDEFARDWPNWTADERSEFCNACSWLHPQADFPDILRYIMQHGSPDNWSAIANSVGTRLPQAEAFDLLTRALDSIQPEEACNISQAISLTKHPDAERVLRAHLAVLWSHPSLWDDDDFNNWSAYGATCCIQHLIALGAPPQDFTDQVRALASHVCARNRDSCRGFLGKYFPWLNDHIGDV